MHLIQKHRFDKPSESGDQDYNKSVSTPVKLVKQRPNEELNRAKKTTATISDSTCKWSKVE